MADGGKRTYHKCPDCEKVGYFRPDEAIVCRQCGRPAAGEGPGEGVAAEQSPTDSSATMMAAIAAGCAGVSIVMVWASPLAFLFALAAVGLSIAVLTNERRDDTATTLAIIALVVGAVFLFLIWWLAWTWDVHYTGSSWEYENSGSGGGCGDDCGGSSGGGGGSSGGTDGGGGGSSGGGGGGVDIGGGGDVGTPGIGWLVAPALLLAARSRR